MSPGEPSRRAQAWFAAGLVAFLALSIGRLAAHPAPFSYLDIQIRSNGLSGRLVLHSIDLAHDLRIADPSQLANPAFVSERQAAIASLVGPRVGLELDGVPAPWNVVGAQPLPEQDGVELRWEARADRIPGRLTLKAHVFPYDPNHQTFVNVYEQGELVRQAVLSRDRTGLDFYTGTRQGTLAVLQAFTASGVHHIAIGPDHILFIVGLLLLGGSIPRLLGIITAFTLGHSVTLALATLRILDPPGHLVEPAIALSIVYIGADNLLAGSSGRDVRPWVALGFGLVHGFGFASVLRETGLPDHALGLSLFAFNLGVEIGQALIVVVVASALAMLRRRNAAVARQVAIAGSITVMLAGAFWFFERVL